MPEFVALRCAGCSTFQVQQYKASGKWQCRLCGEKQSVTRVFARDAKAANVRSVVHELSLVQGEAEHAALDEIDHAAQEDDENDLGWPQRPAIVEPSKSRWRHLVDDVMSNEPARREEDEACEDTLCARPVILRGELQHRPAKRLVGAADRRANEPARPAQSQQQPSKWARFG